MKPRHSAILTGCLCCGLWLAGCPVNTAAEQPLYLSPPASPDGAVQVEIGVHVFNITNVDESQETIEFNGGILLRWSDPRLAYDPTEAGMTAAEVATNYSSHVLASPPRVYQGDFAVKELYEGWRPHVEVLNAVGPRNIGNAAVGVWPDGTCLYHEYFQLTIETGMDLRRYPFDRQQIEVFFDMFVYPKHEVQLVYNAGLSGTWDEDQGIAEWENLGIKIEESANSYHFLNGDQEEFSQIKLTLQIARKPGFVLFSFVLPLLMLACLTWCVFWMDESSISDRVNVSFIGILNVVAFYFVMVGTLPEISYITWMSGFITITFIMLAATVLVNFRVDRLNRTNRKELGDRVDEICRWVFPLGYSAAIGIMTLMMFRGN